jgi:hypothetical protein
VQCLATSNCSGSGLRYCNTTTNQCVACVTDANCTSDFPYCSTTGACVQCLSTRNCGDDKVVCDPLLLHCVPTCTSDVDCRASIARPYCNLNRNVCVECNGDDECPAASPHCEVATGACEVCIQDADCPASTPRCDARSDHRCVQCLTSADCVDHGACTTGECATRPL